MVVVAGRVARIIRIKTVSNFPGVRHAVGVGVSIAFTGASRGKDVENFRRSQGPIVNGNFVNKNRPAYPQGVALDGANLHIVRTRSRGEKSVIATLRERWHPE